MTPVAGGSPRSGEEIQAALRAFVVRWKDYSGTERSEAQTFLNELFACYGTSRLDVGARFEDFQASASGSGFMDLHWPEVVIIEMKRPSRGNQLSRAQAQVMDYWRESADSDKDQPAARYVVICSFLQFEVWEPGRYPKGPRIVFDIEDLPDRYESLAFLAAPNLVPSFVTTTASSPRKPRPRSRGSTSHSRTAPRRRSTRCSASSCRPCGRSSPRTSG